MVLFTPERLLRFARATAHRDRRGRATWKSDAALTQLLDDYTRCLKIISAPFTVDAEVINAAIVAYRLERGPVAGPADHSQLSLLIAA
jgi:hypothetical protein